MKLRRLAGAAALVILGAAALAGVALLWPYSGFREPVTIQIHRGAGTREIGRQLAEHRVIRHELQFLVARALRRSAVLQAGEYKFERPATVVDVYDRIVRGDVVRYQVRVPEGSNMFDIAEIAGRLGIITAEQFLETARDPSMIRDLAPNAPSLEGYLFPSTYYITRDTTAQELCRRMTGQFRQVWTGLNAKDDLHETVTLASLVEKETGVPEERALVSAVFHNRLKMGYLLQCDPTTIYAALLAGVYRGQIYQSDLDRASPYNTYRSPGLPPGPIANPGRDALAATLNPAETDYVYFVAKPDGSGAHVFSRTLEDHNRAVAQYRRGTREEARQNGIR
ncbi:MAG: endolytic transglycosylase MltG [Bryobacteraceae bacterium]|nr:endolytic transglycosylase MltG [Bryobacteraceae bacterium]